MCVCLCEVGSVCKRQQVKKKRKGKMENTGGGRERRHGQTVKAGVILFSGGTLTSHLSCLSVKK